MRTLDPKEAARRLASEAIGGAFKPEALHVYTDTFGDPIYYRIRARLPNGDKWIRPMYLNGNGFELRDPPFPESGKPLYRLGEVSASDSSEPVFFFEGERCADQAARHGVIATTAGGAQSDDKADFSPLANRTVIVWADNDEPGRAHALRVAAKLRSIGCKVQMIDIARLGLTEKDDVVDWLASHPKATADDLMALPRLPDVEEPHEITPDTQATVEKLAKLGPIDYDKVRKQEAANLGVSVTALDAQVKMARGSTGGVAGAIVFEEIEPWNGKVEGAKLLHDIDKTIGRYVAMPDASRHAVALWIAFTWFIDEVQVAPILAIRSPEKGCGKTTLLDLLARLVLKDLAASNISSAALYRTVEEYCPTLLIDEGDSFLRENEELRGILNSGHTRATAYVIRCDGDDSKPTRFSTWCAKAIALIGRLPDTLADRSIPIELRRKLHSEKLGNLRHADKDQFAELRSKLAAFALDHSIAVANARPATPDFLHNRAADNWEPLLAIAHVAGGDWPEIAREAAKSLIEAGVTDSLRVQLLADVRAIFEKERTDRIRSVELLDKLVGDEGKPWCEINHGKPMTSRRLTSMLAAFDIPAATAVRFPDGGTHTAWTLDKFEDAFSRYLPATPPANPLQPYKQASMRVVSDCESLTGGEVLGIANPLQASIHAGCKAVRDSEPPGRRIDGHEPFATDDAVDF